MSDRDDGDWVRLLGAGDAAAVADLRSFLCRGLARSVGARAGLDAVEDFAQEAVLKVLSSLASFRGESRFLTWALAIGVRVAFSELRKARWKDVSLDALPAAPDPAAPPAEAAGELGEVLRRLIDTALTERQRTLIRAELDGMPQAAIAEKMGTTRNALYKLGHDARTKLRRGLIEAGYAPGEGGA